VDVRSEGVGARLGGRWVVDGVDAAPPAGALTGVLGPNGAGKTTLLRMLGGLLRPDRGAVLLDGRPVHRMAPRERARTVALLEQESSAVVPLTVREVVALGRTPYRSWWGADPEPDQVALALEAVDATELAEREYATLSGGERRRVQVARALAQRPSLLLLDEPTNHLDVSAQLSLLAFVARLGTTTVAALHDLNLAATFCDHVLVLHQGRLVAAGPPAETLTSTLLRAVYDVDADVLPHPRTGHPVIALSSPAHSRSF